MKVLILNGSPHKNGSTYTALHEMEAVFHQEGIQTELIHIGNLPIRGCIACGGCESRCPFGVPVIARMSKAASLLG